MEKQLEIERQVCWYNKIAVAIDECIVKTDKVCRLINDSETSQRQMGRQAVKELMLYSNQDCLDTVNFCYFQM
jgi:hypothetical protein